MTYTRVRRLEGTSSRIKSQLAPSMLIRYDAIIKNLYKCIVVRRLQYLEECFDYPHLPLAIASTSSERKEFHESDDGLCKQRLENVSITIHQFTVCTLLTPSLPMVATVVPAASPETVPFL